ncbi:MAG: ABC transporter, ATP-binding protein (cluster 2, ribose/xylose/arabinose/galactose) / ABC transporter, ATP-binding protein (cluster 2, ribose/xylose/arabinose/galactose), partial [uncultured Rubellimicrobium sp.]
DPRLPPRDPVVACLQGVRGRACPRRRGLRCPRGRGPLPCRRERLRQEHAHQDHHRRLHARAGGRNRGLRRGRSPHDPGCGTGPGHRRHLAGPRALPRDVGSGEHCLRDAARLGAARREPRQRPQGGRGGPRAAGREPGSGGAAADAAHRRAPDRGNCPCPGAGRAPHLHGRAHGFPHPERDGRAPRHRPQPFGQGRGHRLREPPPARGARHLRAGDGGPRRPPRGGLPDRGNDSDTADGAHDRQDLRHVRHGPRRLRRPSRAGSAGPLPRGGVRGHRPHDPRGRGAGPDRADRGGADGTGPRALRNGAARPRHDRHRRTGKAPPVQPRRHRRGRGLCVRGPAGPRPDPAPVHRRQRGDGGAEADHRPHGPHLGAGQVRPRRELDPRPFGQDRAARGPRLHPV